MSRSGKLLLALLLATTVAGADWPCWRGPNGTGHVAYDGELVRSFADARLVWQSEAEIPQTYPEGLKFRYYSQSGQCGPIVADGRVYLYYYRPDGEWHDFEKLAKIMADEKTRRKQRWMEGLSDDEIRARLRQRLALLADDVLLCVDARTGETLWERVWELKGVSHARQGRGTFIAAKTGPHAKPCAGDGKVFVLGSSARLYAVDAETGEPAWEIELPNHARIQEQIEAAKAGKQRLDVDRTFCGNCPAYVDGIVVVVVGSDLYGYDAGNGELRWRVDGVGSSTSSPVVHRIDGEAYVVAGRPALIRPSDGKLLWRWDGEPAIDPSYLTVGDGWIVGLSREKMRRTFPDGKGQMEDKAAVGFRFTADAVDQVWTQPDASMSHYIRPVIAHGHLWARNSGSNAKDYFYVLDVETGAMVAKSEKTGVGGRTSGSMIMVGDRILMDRADIIVADPGDFVVPEPEEGWYIQKIPGHDDLLHANSVAMAFADGFCYLRCQDRLVCLDLRAR